MRSALVFALATLASPAFAGISGSAHDFSAGGPAGTQGPTDAVCIYCHTPHNGAPRADIAAPLWNHDYNLATTYTMYDATISSTMDMTVQAAPEGVSLACLSCHDGVMAVSDYLNGPNPNVTTVSMPAAGLLSTDLSNDHPISVVYDPALDADFQPVTAVTGAGVPLFIGTGTNQVECGSCHDVHDDTINPFMRIDNAQSALCLTCHIK